MVQSDDLGSAVSKGQDAERIGRDAVGLPAERWLMKKWNAGFTLIELMVVVIIIAALAAMVLPKLLPQVDEMKIDIARSDVSSISTAVKLFWLRHDGTYPASMDELLPYLEGAARPKDPWKHEYLYEYDPASKTFRVWSCGPDGVSNNGGGDDVTALSGSSGKE